MGHQLNQSCTSSTIANFLGLDFRGADIELLTLCALDESCEGSITFFTGDTELTMPEGVAVICKPEITVPDGCCCIYSSNPRLSFAQVITEFVVTKKKNGISQSAFIHPSAKIGKDTNIGHNSIVDQNVVIGDKCDIGNNVTINRNVEIGNNTRVKSNTVIGEKGFGFEYNENGIPVEFPQIGGVRVGSNVEIGSLCTVASGTLKPTIIEDHVKMDDHIHIAHNVVVGEASIITACAEFSGGVTTGDRVWIGPGATLINKISIGAKAFVGIGAVVTKNVEASTLVAGNPAKKIRDLKA